MKRDSTLTSQIMQLIGERKDRIEQVAGIYKAMLGSESHAKSGRAIDSLIEQGSTVLAEPNDNFRYARRNIGQQLMAFVKQDMIGKPSSVKVGFGKQAKTIYFNRPLWDNTRGKEVIQNNIESVMIDVVLEDVPTTNTFRQQQYRSLAEVAQKAPPEYQMVLYPMLLELSDAPNRHELADQMRQISGIGTPDEQAQKMQAEFQQQMEAMGMQIQEMQRLLQEAQLQVQDQGEKNQIAAAGVQVKQGELQHKGAVLAADTANKKEERRIGEEKDEADIEIDSQELYIKMKQGERPAATK